MNTLTVTRRIAVRRPRTSPSACTVDRSKRERCERGAWPTTRRLVDRPMGVLMETHYCHLAHDTQDLTTTAQKHTQSWRSDDSSPWTSHHTSVSQQGHPRCIGAITIGKCGWLVSRALNSRLQSPPPQGKSTTNKTSRRSTWCVPCASAS